MNSNDIFYYSSSVAVALVAVTLVYLTYQITLSLKSLRRILDDVGEVTSDVTAFKRAVKQGFSKFGSFFGEAIERGGVIYGNRKKRR